MRLEDVDGDGVIDAIASGTGEFTVWRNGGADGWSAPASRPIESDDGPAGVDFADPHVHLADMNGDGLHDIVRVSSDRVEYWHGARRRELRRARRDGGQPEPPGPRRRPGQRR